MISLMKVLHLLLDASASGTDAGEKLLFEVETLNSLKKKVKMLLF